MQDYKTSLTQDEANYNMHISFEWDKWIKEIPPVLMKQGWRIRVLPPFGGAIIRFCVIKGEKSVSVYLDAYDRLGCMHMKPYWEIHPSEDGDCERFWMNEVDELVDGINRSFNRDNWVNKLRRVFKCWRGDYV